MFREAIECYIHIAPFFLFCCVVNSEILQIDLYTIDKFLKLLNSSIIERRSGCSGNDIDNLYFGMVYPVLDGTDGNMILSSKWRCKFLKKYHRSPSTLQGHSPLAPESIHRIAEVPVVDVREPLTFCPLKPNSQLLVLVFFEAVFHGHMRNRFLYLSHQLAYFFFDLDWVGRILVCHDEEGRDVVTPSTASRYRVCLTDIKENGSIILSSSDTRHGTSAVIVGSFTSFCLLIRVTKDFCASTATPTGKKLICVNLRSDSLISAL